MARVKVVDQHGRVYEVPSDILKHHGRHASPSQQEVNIHIHIHVHTAPEYSAPLGCEWTAPLGCAWTAPLGCAWTAPLGCATEGNPKR